MFFMYIGVYIDIMKIRSLLRVRRTTAEEDAVLSLRDFSSSSLEVSAGLPLRSAITATCWIYLKLHLLPFF